jgi:hypothetical protein
MGCRGRLCFEGRIRAPERFVRQGRFDKIKPRGAGVGRVFHLWKADESAARLEDVLAEGAVVEQVRSFHLKVRHRVRPAFELHRELARAARPHKTPDAMNLPRSPCRIRHAAPRFLQTNGAAGGGVRALSTPLQFTTKTPATQREMRKTKGEAVLTAVALWSGKEFTKTYKSYKT